MKKLLPILSLLLMLFSASAWADSTWTHKWDKSQASGGEGFKHISTNNDTVQEATIDKLEWRYQSNSSVTAFSAKGQWFGSKATPLRHAYLSTEKLHGKIKSISLDVKCKETATATLGMSVGGVDYQCAGSPVAALSADSLTYTFVPAGEPAEGKIQLTFLQQPEGAGIIYAYVLSIVYEGEGVEEPVVVKVSPELAFSKDTVTLENGDDGVNPIVNPYNVSPIKYKSGDEDLAHINSNGTIVTTGRKLGSTTVRAWFEGNDTYLADTIQYVLNVVAKPVIPAPTVDVVGGTYTSAQTVTITSNSPLCKAIWYSTTAADSVSMTDEPVIVAGNVAVVTIDKSCTLRCCAVDYNNIGNVLTQEYVMNIPLKADFTADETSTVYYTMNWDSPEEASTWSYFAMDDKKHTWTLMSSVPLENVAPFTQFDANNVYSLGIYYDSKNPQRERAVSPEITIRPNSEVRFYTAFCSVWLYTEDLYMRVYDLTESKVDTLFSAFQWAQKEGFTGPNWVSFQLPLDKYVGHKCQFEFLLAGQDGDNFCVDGFKLVQKDESAEAKVSINQGDEVHFTDHSDGTPESWEWTFDGPTVITSDEQNPTVQFIAPGTYNVTLVVKKEGTENRYVKTGFVTVNVQAPMAHIADADCGYHSPWCMAFVPVGTSVTYNDASSFYPTSWNWTFEGANPGTSTEKSPTVTYNEAGLYGMQLDVANSAGTDKDILLKAIKVGGSSDIWNIRTDEIDKLTDVSMGFYGYYGGSNYLGMRSFAEHFAKPLVEAYVDSVSVYFANVTAANSDAEITVSICPAVNGLPGEPLASKSLKISELAYDDNYVVPTYFDFGKQVNIDSEFFVTIAGFPNEDGDHVSVLSVYRGEAPAYSSTYHEMEDEDPNNSYAGLGTYTWYKNDDEGVSLALTAHLTYVGNATGIETASAIEAEVASSAVYDLKGVRMNAGQNSLRKSGVYVVREGSKVRKVLVK